MANEKAIIKESCGCVRGSIKFLIDGKIVEERNNLVVNMGKDYVAKRLSDGSAPIMGFIAVGDGVVAPAAGDTALGNEVKRNAITTNPPARTANVTTFEAAFVPGDVVGTISEAGLFNAATAGEMFSRVSVGPHTLSAFSSFSIIWNIEVLY